MRVLFVTTALSGRRNWIGEQVRSLRSLGISVDVMAFDTERTRLYYGVGIFPILYALKSCKYDLVHTHHSYTLIMVDIARNLLHSRIPVILTNHEGQILDRQGRAKTWHPTSHLRYSLRVKRFAARRADFVIFVARQLSEIIAVDGRQEIIPCGVDLTKFRPMDRADCRRRLGMPQDGTVIFFSGVRTDKIKNFELARAAYEIIQTAGSGYVLVAGGEIRTDDMPLYYNAANVVLQTSFSEASPMIVKEALACEVPIVSTDVGDTREVIQGIPHCHICPEDPQEIARRVLAVNGYRALGARKRLLSMGLGLEQVAQRIVRVYERTLGVKTV